MSQKYSFPTLYSRNASGTPYMWRIWVEQDKSGSVKIYTEHGTVDGKQVKHSRAVPRGKQKRTVWEQGLFEAESKLKAKVDKEGYVSDIKKMDKAGANRPSTIRPMLAHTYTLGSYAKKGRGAKIVYPAMVQPKFDGIRCLAHMKGGKIVLESRNGKEVDHLDHIRDDLLKFYKNVGDNIIFDGELYSHSIPFEVINGIVRSKTYGEAEEKLSKFIYFYIYDCINLENLGMSNDKRYSLLKKVFKDINVKSLSLSPTYIVKSEEEMVKYHAQFVKDGYEGIMIRNIDAPYEIKKRSKHLQKYKSFEEEEFKIVGYHEEEGGGVVWDCVTKEGKAFAVRPRGTDEYRKKMLKDAEDYIGAKLTVIFQEYTKDGIPRFPVGKAIRWDK
jgi:ATP-dependent DNA ligase